MISTLPGEWKVERLLDLVTIRSGQVDPKLAQFRNMPLIAPDHIESGTGRLLAVRSAREQGAISGKYLVDPGDIIYSKIRPYLMKAYRAEFSALCSADMYPLKPRSGADGSFVLNVLLGRDFTNYAVGESMRSGIPKVNREGLAGYELGVPPDSEQAAIGAALRDADGLAQSLEQLIAKKHAIKQGLMQELLTGRTRMPGFSGVWQTVRLGALADPRKKHSFVGGPFGSSLKASEYVPAGVRIIQLQNIGDGRFLDDYSIFTSAKKADELIANNIYPGDILMAKMGDPVARACIVPSNQERYLMASDGIRLAVDDQRIHPGLVVELINSREFREQAEAVSTGTTRKRISLGALRNLTLTLPKDHDEQVAIGQVLGDADQEIAALARRLETTRAIKQGMMQELLTGRTRLVREGAA